MLAAVITVASLFRVSAFAQDPVQTELAQLRKLIELQNAKIDALNAQVNRLAVQIEGKATPPTPATIPGVAAAPVPAAEPEAAPVPRVLASAPKVHIVVKGESLEKIGKQYGITVAELQKLNNISDPKKLQVGQQLTLPPDKKE